MKSKLTKPQLEELKRLAQAPQEHRGRWRVRVQNSLRSKKLVRFTRNGEPFMPSVVEIMVSAAAGYSGVTCEITDAGRAAVEGDRREYLAVATPVPQELKHADGSTSIVRDEVQHARIVKALRGSGKVYVHIRPKDNGDA